MRPTSPLVACFLPRWVGAVRWIGQNESVKATIEVGVASSSISCSAGARNPVRYQPDGDALSMRSPHPRGGGGGNPSGSRSLNPLRSRPHIRLQAPARRRYAKHSRMTLLSTRTGETNDVWRLGRIDVLDEPFTAAQSQEIADLGSKCCGHANSSRTVNDRCRPINDVLPRMRHQGSSGILSIKDRLAQACTTLHRAFA